MLKVLIADDESLARKRLIRMLQNAEAEKRIKILDEAEDGLEVLEKLDLYQVDLLFLDIRMPELDGFEVLAKIPPSKRPMVIFTTAYHEYAIKAFEENAIDYILKPIAEDRLNQALAKAEERKATALPNVEDPRLSKLLNWLEKQEKEEVEKPEENEKYPHQLTLQSRDRLLVLQTHQIVAIETADNIARIFVLKDGSTTEWVRHLASYTLDELEARLDPDAFLRIHRNAIVRLDQIKALQSYQSNRYKVILTGDLEIIASRERGKILKKRIGKQ